MSRLIFLIAFTFALPLSAEPVSLFDGKTLDGWDFDPAMWRVEDGMITGGSTSEKITHNDFICTKKNYRNFELQLTIRCSGDPATGLINSGIQIRSVRVPGGAHMSGYQVDCGKGWFGKIYDEFRRNRVIAEPIDAAALDKVVDVYGWNTYRIRAEGPRIQVWINDVPAIDYTETDPNIALDGQIGPQVHSGGICLVQIKDITIEELPPTPDAPTWESLGGVEAARKLVAPPSRPKTQAAAAKPRKDISYNDVEGTALTAQEQLKKFHLADGYEIELVVQEDPEAGIGKFISVYFDQRGRMWTQTALEYPVDANENPAAAEAVYAGKGKDKILVYPRESLNAPLPAEGLKNPTVFAEGLAIPLGILPWGAGDACYALHGHDLKFFKDTDGDGKADTHDVILTGFGIQDSHLFPHQFTRAPGGWIWMAQGLFNNSSVTRPGSDEAIPWPKCSMARMRPDGSEFEVTSTGPNNIWGLVMTGEGETFIQEANDFGYPVMPFHEYAYYPGGMAGLRKSYQPEFPPTADFRMGGTGLSGLALLENGSSVDPKADLTMLVANPIISKVQTLAMFRTRPDDELQSNITGWRLEQRPDFITCDDPFFRPVAMTQGPDGAIYIVDWYNKIISHNEVPRNHPDRDKTRGRIWRVYSSHLAPRDEPTTPPSPTTTNPPSNQSTTSPAHLAERNGYHTIPDFTQLSSDELINTLGTTPVAKAHLAWQTLADRKGKETSFSIRRVAYGNSPKVAARMQALWAHQEQSSFPLSYSDEIEWGPLARAPHDRLRESFISLLGDKRLYSFESHGLDCSRSTSLLRESANDPDPGVRASAIQSIASLLAFSHNPPHDEEESLAVEALLSFARPSLPGPLAQSSRGPQQIPVREAYDREFERFLVRMFLERHPDLVAKFLDSDAALDLPIEARVLAALSLDPKTSASRVASILPQLDRIPNTEEFLRLAQHPEQPGAGQAIASLLNGNPTRIAIPQMLIGLRTALDPAKIAPFVTDAARTMLKEPDPPVRDLALQLISAFQLTSLESELVAILTKSGTDSVPAGTGNSHASILHTLRDLRSGESELFATLAKSDPDPLIRDAALEALASSRAPDATTRLLTLYPELTSSQRKAALDTVSSTKAGAKTIVTALLDKSLPQSDLDGPTVERLATVLGDDPAITELQNQLGGIFREVLLLDGSEAAWVDSKITLEGPFTVETWVRLAPGITNHDDILGVPGGTEMNFHQSRFRVFAGPQLRDVAVASKPMTPDLWTHIAVTRDAKNIIRIYQNGELDATATKPAPDTWRDCRIGWSGPKSGTEGALTEFRVWNHERHASEIRANFDRIIASADGMTRYDDAWGKLGKGARVAKTLDTPPLLTQEQAEALDTKFAKYSALAPKGDPEKGQPLAALCIACHQIGNTGGQIGPNLSGAGAMGLEGVLRNILTPNAAMEAGYRIFRVEMKNGDLIDAFYVSEDKQAIIIRQPGAPDRRLDKKDVARTHYIRRSLMPEGLLDALTDDQVADLLVYLMTLKG